MRAVWVKMKASAKDGDPELAAYAAKSEQQSLAEISPRNASRAESDPLPYGDFAQSKATAVCAAEAL
jgi:hypothetical protein